MAIAFDAQAAVQESDNSVTLAHTLGSGSNRIVLLLITGTGPDNASITLSTVTYNGVAATQLTNVRNNIGTWYLYAVYYVLESSLPAAGTYNAVVTGGSGQYTMDVAVISLSGANQGAPTAASNSAGGVNTISTNIVTTADDSWVVDNLYAYYGIGDGANVGAGQTSRTVTEDFEVHRTSTKPVATAGTTSMSWTNGVGSKWSTIYHTLAAIQPAGGGSPPATPTPNIFMFGSNF